MNKTGFIGKLTINHKRDIIIIQQVRVSENKTEQKAEYYNRETVLLSCFPLNSSFQMLIFEKSTQ